MITNSRSGEPSENYTRAAIEGESAIVASALPSTRNYVLNRSAFKLGTIPGMPTDTAVSALLRSQRTTDT